MLPGTRKEPDSGSFVPPPLWGPAPVTTVPVCINTVTKEMFVGQ